MEKNLNQDKKPAQVPGDAESPPQGSLDKTVHDAIQRSDPTEPVQAEKPNGDK
jgi:hypothetical protein